MKKEDQNTEYKQSWREDYLKWICGFANTAGGRMLIGVADDKMYVANVGSLPETWTLKKLLGKHPSRPYNPTIAGCVYLTGKIETWGRGVKKVFDECRKHGCPSPLYDISPGDPGDIQVRIDAAPDAIAEAQVKGRTELSIIRALASGEKQSSELAAEIGQKRLSGALKRGIRRLVELGVVELTQPDSLRSPTQRYRLTAKGIRVREAAKNT